MKVRVFIITALLATMGAFHASALHLSVQPGTLATALKNVETPVTSLELEGSIDVRDMLTIRDMEGLVNLDLSNATVERINARQQVWLDRSLFFENEIPEYVFFQSNIKKVSLPKDIVKIGEGAFAYSAIEEVSAPSSLRTIGDHAFRHAEALKSLSALNAAVMIGKESFRDCTALTKVELPQAIYVGSLAFEGSGVKTLSLPALQGADSYALAGMPELQSASACADAQGLFFGNRNLNRPKNLPDQVPPYYMAFCDRYIEYWHLPEVRSLDTAALYNTGYTVLALSPGLREVGDYAFAGMANLEFIDARNLEGTIPSVDEHTFAGLDCANIELCVDGEYEEEWKNADGWRNFFITTIPVNSVKNPNAYSGITLSAKGFTITVTSDDTLENVEAYSLDGALLASGSGSTTVTLHIPGIIHGTVVIVNARSLAGSKSFRIML